LDLLFLGGLASDVTLFSVTPVELSIKPCRWALLRRSGRSCRRHATIRRIFFPISDISAAMERLDSGKARYRIVLEA